MMKKHFLNTLLVMTFFSTSLSQAEIKEYIRDYRYQGENYDTQSSCRVNALEGVKRELLDELGTYIGSVVKINQDSLGHSYMSHDVINITAGVVAMKVLEEKWKQPVYYVKAGMKADPDDVLIKLKSIRADLDLEKSLRNSFEELQHARAELEEMKAQLAQYKKSGATLATVPLITSVSPVPESVVNRMQKIEDKTQKALAENLEVGNKNSLPPTLPVSETIKPTTESIAEVKPSLAQVNADQAQKNLEGFVIEEKKVPPALPIEAKTTALQSEQMAVVINPEAQKLVDAYRRAVQNIEVEEAFQHGIVAQISGDFSTLVKEMLPLAEKGYPRAQVHMGWIYERGVGVPQDYQKALEWYEKATSNGAKNAPAQIGNMYEKGFGVKQNYEKAAEYYKRSIELDGSLGYARMGYLYETGKGVQLDRVKAVEYYDKAIAKGNYHAMTLLGLLYQHGNGGLDRNEEKAIELYKQAIDHGDPLAMTRLGEMYNQGKGGLDKDHEKAMALFLESARYRLPAAYAHLGRMYDEGWATKQDFVEAKKWYEKAAENDAIFAMKRLGIMYKEGRGTSRDWGKATYWLKRAANLGDDKAQEILNKRSRWH